MVMRQASPTVACVWRLHACLRPPQGIAIAGTSMSKSNPWVRHEYQHSKNKHDPVFLMVIPIHIRLITWYWLSIWMQYIAHMITWVRASSSTWHGQWGPDQTSLHQLNITHSAGCHGNATGLGQMACECWSVKPCVMVAHKDCLLWQRYQANDLLSSL